MSRTLLYIDDEPLNLSIMTYVLNGTPYELVTASNALHGLQLAHDICPDLILMDIHMPVMHGIDAARLLKTNPATYKIPIILLTADAYDLKIAQTSGCSDYLTKPFSKTVLLRAIEHALASDNSTLVV